jgi:hypothetical protein
MCKEHRTVTAEYAYILQYLSLFVFFCTWKELLAENLVTLENLTLV